MSLLVVEVQVARELENLATQLTLERTGTRIVFLQNGERTRAPMERLNHAMPM